MTKVVTVDNLSVLIKAGEIPTPLLQGWNIDKHGKIQARAEEYTSRCTKARHQANIGVILIFGSFFIPLVSFSVFGDPYHMVYGGIHLGLATTITALAVVVSGGVFTVNSLFPNRDFRDLEYTVDKFVKSYYELSKTTGRTFAMFASMSKEHLQEMASTSLTNLCRQMLVYAGDRLVSKEQLDLQHKIQETYDLYASFNLAYGGYNCYYEKAKAMNKQA